MKTDKTSKVSRKANLEVIDQLIQYFDAEIIGSYLLVKAELLAIEYINDIDVCIPKNKLENAYKFLEDLGYSQTFISDKQIGYKEGRAQYNKIPQGDFTNKEYYNIDVIEKAKDVFTIPTLIAEKFKRGSDSDFKQLAIICSSKIGQNLMDLQHWKDTTQGLHAIDQNPKDVTYEWIIENSFQIGKC